MKGQISIDLLFAVFLVMIMLSTYTSYTEFVSKKIISSFSYVLCDYVATTTAYEEEYLSASGQGIGNDFSISFGSGEYGITAEVKIGQNSVTVDILRGGEVLNTCSKAVRR